MIADVPRQCCLRDGLLCRPADTSDANSRTTGVTIAIGNRLAGQFQYRFEQAKFRIANFELRRVYADGDALCAGGVIISCQSPLMTLVETALGSQSQRMGWNHQARAQFFGNPRG